VNYSNPIERPLGLAAAGIQDHDQPSAARNSGLRTFIGFGISIVALGSVAWWGVHQKTPSFPTSGPEIALIVVAVALTASRH
jgi:hypothetical protein